MRKIAATAISIALMLVAVVGMGSESFYPKPITFLLAAPVALFTATWLMNARVPYKAEPSSRSFGKRDNRGLRTIIFLVMAVFSYLALIYFGASIAAMATGQAQYRVGIVNSWDPSSRRAFTRRRSGHCARLGATIKTADGDLDMSMCMGKNLPFMLGEGSAVFVETVESPFGTLVTGNLRF